MGDVWLLKFAWPLGLSGDIPLFSHPRHSSLRAWRSTEGEQGYAYLAANAPVGMPLPSRMGGDWTRLVPILELAGASQGASASWHYVVETDVLPAKEDDFNAWYDQEHLPGLASVPGTVRAVRYASMWASPRYYACYDLVSADSLGNPAWLAVRNTSWSSRIRPVFRNTRRTMFRRALREVSGS